MNKTPQDILNTYWGYGSFRPLQEDIIRNVSAGGDTVALLPTGGGKSICYQIPALMQEGITIVVSPLIALIKDQVLALQEKGIKALSITSGIPYKELDTLLDNCIYGNYKLLYLSPERLQQELVQERIRQMRVHLIAVDEAHCISQWGHDFRPAYLKVARLREIHPEVPILALTATATQKVLKDIEAQLALKDTTIYKSSYQRPNLTYSLSHTTDKNTRLVKLLKQTSGSAIVYVRNRKATQNISQLLISRGLTATFYHGGLSREQRDKHYTLWKNDEIKIMVGTSAFGMGIDKGNVDTVIHLEIPDSIENYFQEAGRAGRNNQASKAVLIYNENDELRLENQFVKVIPDVAFVKEVYKRLSNYFQISYGEGEQTVHQFNFSQFCDVYSLYTIKTFNTLQTLDRNGIIQLEQEFSKRATVTFKVKDVALTYYLIKNPQLEAVTKSILRTYGGVYEQVTTINYTVLSKKAEKSTEAIHKVLLTLDEDDIIDYTHKSFDSTITFLVPREDDRTINRIAPYIKEQIATKKKQVDAVKNYINKSTECRTLFLLKYFGEDSNDACGRCDNCLRNETTINSKDIGRALLEFLSDGEKNANAFIQLPYPKEAVVHQLRVLLESKKITITTSNTYKLL